MKKQIFLITIIGLLLLALPLMANTETIGDSEEIIASGTLPNLHHYEDSTDINWTIDNKGTLRLSGSGKMLALRDDGLLLAWDNYSDQIKKAIIEDGFTSIGINAFHDCVNLEEVIVPESVIYCCNGAFTNCKKLKNVDFLCRCNTNDSIAMYTFYGCESLSNIVIPDSVTYIADYAFANLKGTTIYLPDSVESIGGAAFYGSTNLTIIVPSCQSKALNYIPYEFRSILTHPDIETDKAIEPTCTETGLTEGKHCSVCGEVIVAQEIIPIEEHSLVSHLIADIEPVYQCTECGKLFSDAEGTVEIIDSGECGNGVIWILNNEGLLTISGNGYMTSNPWCGDGYTKNVIHVVIHENVRNIVKDAFSGCDNLISIIIPDSVTSIGNSAFRACEKLDNVVLPNGISSIQERVFQYCKSLSDISIPNSVTKIGYCSFDTCISLTSISIPNSVTSIDSYAFSNCFNLNNIIIPDTVITIGQYAFAHCSSLSNINLPDSISNISYRAFYDCSNLVEIILPKSSTIYNSAFESCYNLQTITISGDASYIYDDAFLDCYSISCINVPVCYSYTIQWLINHDYEDSLNIGPHARIVISDAVAPTETDTGLTEGSYCDICNETLSEQMVIPALCDMNVLRLPSSLNSIDDEAFISLACQAIIIPDGCTTIGEKAFANNDKLLYVRIPASVTSISDDAFEGCDNVAVFREEN